MSIGGSATGVTSREPKVSDWRGGRAGAITSSKEDFAPLNSAARHRAWRVTWVTIWPRLHQQKRSDTESLGLFVKRLRSRAA